MKILTKFIFVFITIISFTGCKKDLTQVIEEFYPDGNPKIVYYLDKNNNKVKVEYYPNGKLKYVGGLNNGLGHGIWKYYHPNGKLWSEAI